MNIIQRILTKPFRCQVESVIQGIYKNIKNAPIHCDKPMEYIGEHSGFFSNTQFYQCKKCKQLALKHKH